MMHAASCSIVCSPSLWNACTLPGERGTSMARHCQGILMHASRKYLYAWHLNPMKTFHNATTAPAPFQARACQPCVMQRTSSCLSMLLPTCPLVPLTTWRTCSVAAGPPTVSRGLEAAGRLERGDSKGFMAPGRCWQAVPALPGRGRPARPAAEPLASLHAHRMPLFEYCLLAAAARVLTPQRHRQGCGPHHWPVSARAQPPPQRGPAPRQRPSHLWSPPHGRFSCAYAWIPRGDYTLARKRAALRAGRAPAPSSSAASAARAPALARLPTGGPASAAMASGR